MLVAELRRKLPDIGDIDPTAMNVVDQVRRLLSASKEDLLTSDVFGALKYLPLTYLSAVMEQVAQRNPHSEPLTRHIPQLVAGLKTREFLFWPSYPTPLDIGAGSTEPDVVIRTENTFLIVEAKLGSGFGESQIERELGVALDHAGGREPFLLLVTKTLAPPRWGYSESATAAPTASRLLQARNRVLWIDWAGLLAAIRLVRTTASPSAESETDTNGLVDDLIAVTELRGIRPFFGIGGSLVQETLGPTATVRRRWFDITYTHQATPFAIGSSLISDCLPDLPGFFGPAITRQWRSELLLTPVL